MSGERTAPSIRLANNSAVQRKIKPHCAESDLDWVNLPPELWARIFRYLLPSVQDLGSTACVCRSWRDELRTRRADGLWRDVWDSRSLRSSAQFLEQPVCWRTHVAASQLLAASRFGTVGRIVLPPKRTRLVTFSVRADTSASSNRRNALDRDCSVVLQDQPVQVRTPRCLRDLHVAVGRATNVHAFCGGQVLIGFERGLALLQTTLPDVLASSSLRSSKSSCSGVDAHSDSCDTALLCRRNSRSSDQSISNILDVECSNLLGGIILFARESCGERSQVIAATTTSLLVAITIDNTASFSQTVQTNQMQTESSRPKMLGAGAETHCKRRTRVREKKMIWWRILDNFEVTDSHLVSLVVSENKQHALVGFSNGRIRVVDIVKGHLAHMLSMRESPDVVVASGNYIIGSNFSRTCVTIWDIDDGRALHRFDQTSVGWEEISTVTGICRTRHKNCFALWDGKSSIRILDAWTGRFTKLVDARGAVSSDATRNVIAEVEHGAAAAHVGPNKLILCSDERTVVVAASNRVLILDIEVTSTIERTSLMRQLDGARGAVLAVSTDNRYVVTAESDVFGRLAARLSSSGRCDDSSHICVWDVKTGKLRRQISGVSRISSLSVADNTIAVVSGGPRPPSKDEPAMSRGDAIIFRFGIATTEGCSK